MPVELVDLFVGQLAVRSQHDSLVCKFAIHLVTSLRLKVVAAPWSCRSALPQSRQLSPQLFRRSEERILGGLFCCIQHLSDRSQPESLIMLQFKNHPLARRQFAQRSLNPLAEYLAIQFF